MEKIDHMIKDALKDVPQKNGMLDEIVIQKCSMMNNRKVSITNIGRYAPVAVLAAVALLISLLVFIKNTDGNKKSDETTQELLQDKRNGANEDSTYQMTSVANEENCVYIEKTNLRDIKEYWIRISDYSDYSLYSPGIYYNENDKIQQFRIELTEALANEYFCVMDDEHRKMVLDVLVKISEDSYVSYVREAAKLVYNDLSDNRIVLLIGKEVKEDNKIYWFNCEPEKLEFKDNISEVELSSVTDAGVKIRIRVRKKMNHNHYWYFYNEI